MKAKSRESMTSESRKSIEQIANSGLPGLVHFGSKPLRLVPHRQARRVKVYIPGKARLELHEVVINREELELVSKSTVTVSSVVDSAERGKGESYRRGKYIRTTRQTDPFWEVAFPDAVRVNEILIFNRLIPSGFRGYGICVEIEHDGETWRFDNLSTEAIKIKLEQFEAALNAFFTFLESLPAEAREKVTAAVAQARSAASDLLNKVKGAVESRAWNADELSAARRALLLAIIKAMEGISRPHAEKAILWGAACLDWLIYRGRGTVDPDEGDLKAVSAIFCAEFLTKNRVKRSFLMENGRYVNTLERSEYVETLVNRLYAGAMEDHTVLPIMFRKHSMGGNKLRHQAQAYISSMKEIESEFAKIDYEIAICYGTLLGAVRDHAFIAHDDDVDMVVLLKGGPDATIQSELADITARLTANGVRVGGNGRFLKVHASVGGKSVDMFPIERRSETSLGMFMEALKFREVRSDLVLPFKSISFYGESFFGMAQSEEFLADRYGPDWTIPKRSVGGKWMDARAPEAIITELGTDAAT